MCNEILFFYHRNILRNAVSRKHIQNKTYYLENANYVAHTALYSTSICSVDSNPF